MLTIAGIITAPAPQVYRCDLNLYMTSNNQVCDGNMSKDFSSYSFPMMLRSETCFKDVLGETIKFKIHEMGFARRYNKMYYTTDYEIKTETDWDCMYNGERNRETYKRGFKCNQFTGNTSINGEGCHVVVSASDKYCYRDSACSYYNWSLTRIGKLYPIYEQIDEIWYIKIKTDH